MSAAAVIAFLIRYKRLLMYVGAAGVVLLAIWWAWSAIYDAGAASVQAKWDAAVRAAEAEASADTIQLQDAIAAIDQGVTTDMEAIDAVRTVWRDKVVYKAVDVYRDNPDCRAPDWLLGEINGAAAAYAAAASGSSGPVVRPAGPAP